MKDIPYTVQVRAGSGEGRLYELGSSRGIPSPQTVTEEEILLLKTAQPEKTDRVLTYGPRTGAEEVILSDQVRNGSLTAAGERPRRLLLTEYNRRKNESENLEVMKSSDPGSDVLRKCDKAYIVGRDRPDHILKYLLNSVSSCLKDSGDMRLVLPRQRGEKLRDFCEKLGEVSQTLHKESVSFKIEKVSTPQLDPLVLNEVSHSVRGTEVDLEVLEGVFSASDLNRAEMLARSTEISQDNEVLDLGCRHGETSVFVNSLYGAETLALTRSDICRSVASRNLGLNDVEECKAVSDDGPESISHNSFDVCLFRPGSDNPNILRNDLQEVQRVLRPGSRVAVCHRKERGIESLLDSVFGGFSVDRREFDYQITSATN